MRVWAAGCCCRYRGWRGRLKFARKPFCVIGEARRGRGTSGAAGRTGPVSACARGTGACLGARERGHRGRSSGPGRQGCPGRAGRTAGSAGAWPVTRPPPRNRNRGWAPHTPAAGAGPWRRAGCLSAASRRHHGARRLHRRAGRRLPGQRVRHVRAAQPALPADPEDDPHGPAWRHLEAPGLRGLCAQQGEWAEAGRLASSAWRVPASPPPGGMDVCAECHGKRPLSCSGVGSTRWLQPCVLARTPPCSSERLGSQTLPCPPGLPWSWGAPRPHGHLPTSHILPVWALAQGLGGQDRTGDGPPGAEVLVPKELGSPPDHHMGYGLKSQDSPGCWPVGHLGHSQTPGGAMLGRL